MEIKPHSSMGVYSRQCYLIIGVFFLLNSGKISESFLTQWSRQLPWISVISPEFLFVIAGTEQSIHLEAYAYASYSWASQASWKPFSAAGLCSLAPAGSLKQPSLVSSPITLWEPLNDRHGASVYPVGLLTHTMSVNTPYHLPAYADFFFLVYSSPGCRHLVNPFRTYQLCSSAHKPITLEAQC